MKNKHLMAATVSKAKLKWLTTFSKIPHHESTLSAYRDLSGRKKVAARSSPPLLVALDLLTCLIVGRLSRPTSTLTLIEDLPRGGETANELDSDK